MWRTGRCWKGEECRAVESWGELCKVEYWVDYALKILGRKGIQEVCVSRDFHGHACLESCVICEGHYYSANLVLAK